MEVLREGYRILFSRGPPLSDQPLPMPSYSPSSIRGKSLGERVSRSSPQTSHRTGSSDSRLLQSPIRGPEGLWVLRTHQSIVALLLWQYCLSTCQQAYSRQQAIGPALVMTISSLLGGGLCTGALSEALRYLLPGEGTAPATVSGAETAS